MKTRNLRKFAAILAIFGIIALTATACDNSTTGGNNGNPNKPVDPNDPNKPSTGEPQKVEFTGYDADGNMYTLILTEKTNATSRAAVTTTTYLGWGYVLIYKMEGLPDQISEGFVSAVNNDTYTLELEPYVDYAPIFSVSIGSGDYTITMIVGVITFDNGGTLNGGALTPNKPIVSDPSGFNYIEEDDGTLTIVGYTGDVNVLKITAELDGKHVTGIWSQAFRNNKNITSLTIPNSVTSVRTPLLISTLWYSLLL